MKNAFETAIKLKKNWFKGLNIYIYISKDKELNWSKIFKKN